MRYSLTINTDDADELAPVLALLQGDDDAATPNATAPALDSAGLPHDERIHLKSKKQNADKTWGRKRGVPDAEYERVVNELRARVGGAQQPQQQYVMPPQYQQPPQPMGGVPGMTYQPPQPQLATFPQPVTPQAIAQPVAQPQQQSQAFTLDFAGFIDKLGPLMQSGRISPDALNATVQRVGAQYGNPALTMNDLPAQQQFIAPIVNDLTMHGLWA